MNVRDKNAYHILIIEDNPGDFLMIEEYLQEKIENPQIKHAKNFKEAFTIFNEQEFVADIILLDLSLPDKSGNPLVNEILSMAKKIPVIILTGFADIEFSIQSIAEGVYDYLVKDEITATTLYKSIIYSLERKKNNEQLIDSEKRYSDLFNLSPQPMWLYQLSTLQFIQVNKATVELYGYSEAELLNMTIMDIRPESEKEKTALAVQSRVTGHDEIYSGSFKHAKKSGEIIDVEIYSTPFYINGQYCRSVVAIDVTERNLYEHKLTKAIIKTQEDERYEIGSELHDNVCQILATSLLSLGMIRRNIEPPAIEFFENTKEYISLATVEIRNLSHRLAPAFFDDSSFEDAVEVLFNNFNLANQFKVNINFDSSFKAIQLNKDLQLNLYRIMQEQLRNTIKYAQATTISLNMKIQNGNLLMQLEDDGIGFNQQEVKSGIGIANMKRRAELFNGNFTLFSAPGKGCKLSILMPLSH